MAIIVAPDPYLVTVDHKAQRIIEKHKILTLNAAVIPHHDGRFVWLTRVTTNSVVAFDLATKTYGTAINIGINPTGIWGNGRLLYRLSGAGGLNVIDLVTGTPIGASTLPAGTYRGITGDSRFVYVVNVTTGNIETYDPTTATLVGGFTAPTNAFDVHHDGRFIWILTGAASVQGTIKQYDPNTGTEIGSFNITNYSIGHTPSGLTGDGRFLYYTERI